jgi:quinol-cytochrome oxidoreductase complex cytochrome b subunit
MSTTRNANKRPNFFHHLHPPKIPAREARFTYTFGLGGISLFLFIVTVITGALELIYYVPSGEDANRSLHILNLLVPYGQLIRSLHFWAAQGLVVTCVVHMLRVVLTGGYKKPRRFNWLLGVTLLILTLFFDFTGYALRWDDEISWALMVGTNLVKSIPLIGSSLYGLIVGGAEIGHPTIVRFYGWHIYGLPLLAIFIMAWHLFRVRRDGGISRSDAHPESGVKIDRATLVRREVQAMLIVSILLLGLAAFFPPSLGAQADFQNLPAEATAPWFFLWIQQLLRLGPPFQMGVLLPAGLLLLLSIIPYVFDTSQEGTGIWFNRAGRAAQMVLLVTLAFVLILTTIGALR